MLQVQDSILKIKGIGEKTALLYQKLGIETVGDLLTYYPRDYEQYEKPVTVSEAEKTDFAAIRCMIRSAPSVRSFGRMQVTSCMIADEAGSMLKAVWFGMPYLRNTLQPGGIYIFRGRIQGTGKNRGFEQPGIFRRDQYEKLQSALQPVYALTAGLTNQSISKSIAIALEEGAEAPDTIPADVIQKYSLMDLSQAIRQMHFPKDREIFAEARRRIVFEEFYHFLYEVSRMKEQIEQEKNHFAITKRPETDEFIKMLPFRLTGAQLRTWKEISDDLTGPHMMYRMIQGDVGSGKTILAFLAMYQTALCHYQSALMVPTQVLANQHYQKFCSMNEKYGLGLKILLLTGSSTAAQKRKIREAIQNHEADLIIGTHALIQENVEYDDLALVITDEQHRFGVRQRDSLSEKGCSPHVCVMSATPIPRSLAMILYGDLDISLVDERPAERIPIKNCVVDIGYRPKAWNFIKNQVLSGRQAYVICPLVEASEQSDGEDVVGYQKKLQQFLGEGITVEYLHGKMKDAKKDELMTAFAENKIQVLVSTTVIEVGIDVPNASVILIEDAEKFGLAQLHQLRGRVGRGKWQSYCILMDTSGKEHASKRLGILNRSNDGFEIASEDLKLRGPGDFFGIRQSGDLPFHQADVYTDAAVLKQASEAVTEARNIYRHGENEIQ